MELPELKTYAQMFDVMCSYLHEAIDEAQEPVEAMVRDKLIQRKRQRAEKKDPDAEKGG
jgi:hypothetical protein